MTGLGLAMAGWAAFGLAAAVALRSLHAAALQGQAVARACHEVRGPLAAARLGLEPGREASTGRLRAIEVELARATVALDDLQAVQRIGLGAPQTDTVDVRTWLADSVEAWRPVAAARGRDIRLDWRGAEAAVRGAQARLAQITGNLIANAIDHGQGCVEIGGWATGARIVVEVADGGPGLPRDVTDRLTRGTGSAWGGREWGRVRPNGRGHGLRIARAVAEAHGGRLTAAATRTGARLVLSLPRA